MGRRDLALLHHRRGQVLTAAGIFLVGFLFFEGIIGLGGDRWNLPNWLLPAVVIGLGVLILVRAVSPGRSADAEPPADHPAP